jgi:hypothetical protein
VRQARATRARRRYEGFTLFEMVVTICSIVILYMIAEERLNQLPAAAERANFYAVLEQIKTGVSFEMVTKVAAGEGQKIRELEGTNPMDLLIETPSNYRGELESVTDAVERRNAWYFETSTGELVYVVGGSSIRNVEVIMGGIPTHLGQIRLKIMNIYAAADDKDAEPGANSGGLVRGRDTPAAQRGNWEGLLLVPVREYTWERQSERPIPLD